VAYLVTRFPVITETFILRELGAVAERVEFPIEVLALRPGRRGAVHSAAAQWLAVVQMGSIARGTRESLRMVVTRPKVVGRVVRTLLSDYGRDPAALVKSLALFVLAASFVPVIRRRGIAHLHAHFATEPAEAAWILAAFTGVTYSITAHAYDLFMDTRGLDRRTGGAQFVACISEYNQRFLHGRDPALECPLVHCGVETRGMRRPPHAPNPESTRVVMVSSFQPKKGHAVLIEALRRSPALRQTRLDLVGTGPLQPEIKALVTAAGLKGRVNFLDDQPEDAVRRIVAGSDVLVQPSVVAPDGDMDGIPNTLIEAMALGIPVVTTSLSGIPELVIDGVTGVVVSPEDPDELAAGLRKVIDDPEAARRRALAGLAKVEAEFDIACSAAAMASLLERSLDRARCVRPAAG
jgi:colanic acid/amylovoran biosynthesis glycosyltransferase